MDFNNLKEKITKKHIIIGTSAIVLIAGAITAGVVLSGDSDKENTDSNFVAEITEATTTATTTTVVTTTAPKTTTAVTTTTKPTTTTKKSEKKKETKKETKKEEPKKEESSTSSNEGYYEEPEYEYEDTEPAYEYEYEEPKQEAPKQEEAPAPEPEPEPEPVYEEPADNGHGGFTGARAEWYDYAISQGCSDAQAATYANAVDAWGADRVMIGDPTNGNGGWWAVWWLEDPETGYWVCGG